MCYPHKSHRKSLPTISLCPLYEYQVFILHARPDSVKNEDLTPLFFPFLNNFSPYQAFQIQHDFLACHQPLSYLSDLIHFLHPTPPVSSGPISYQISTAFTKNRYLHAVCSTGLLYKVLRCHFNDES